MESFSITGGAGNLPSDVQVNSFVERKTFSRLCTALCTTVLLSACVQEQSDQSQSDQSKSDQSKTEVRATDSQATAKQDASADRPGDFVNSPLYNAIPTTNKLKDDLRKRLHGHIKSLNLSRVALYFDGEHYTKDDLSPFATPDAINYLRDVNIKVLGITDSDLESFSKLRLETFFCSDNPLEDLHALSEMKTLKSLDLAGTRVNSKGLQVISKLPNLAGVGLARTSITDADLLNLYGMNQLRALDLRKCKNVTKQAVEQLKRKLPECKVLY